MSQNDIFYKKYITYKNKYLRLKKQLGGYQDIEIYQKDDEDLFDMLKDIGDIYNGDIIQTLKNYIWGIMSKELGLARNLYTVDNIELYEKTKTGLYRKLTDKRFDTEPPVTAVWFELKKSVEPSKVPIKIVSGFDPTQPELGQEQKIVNKSGTFNLTIGGTFEGTIINGTQEFDQVRIEKAEGTLTTSDATTVGTINNYKLEGNGKIIYRSGSELEGLFVNGYLVKGTIKTPGGFVSEGIFINNHLNGKGKITSPSATEEGIFKNGELKQGTIKYSSGLTSTGSFINKKLNGNGKKEYVDVSVEEGIFKDDELNGLGRKEINRLGVYEGEFMNGKLVKGKKIIGGYVYEGNFNHTEKLDGENCKITTPDGHVLSGTCINDMVVRGKMINPDGTESIIDHGASK